MKYDHMLNGSGSRQHHQEMITQAENERLMQEFEQNNNKKRRNIRAVVHMIIQSLAK